jgi:hypothetical protein
LPSLLLSKKYKGKVKFSLYRPWSPLWLRDVETPTFSDIPLTDGGKVVSSTRRPPFYPQEDSWYSFLLEADSTPGSYCSWEGLSKLKKFTSSGLRTGDLLECPLKIIKIDANKEIAICPAWSLRGGIYTVGLFENRVFRRKFGPKRSAQNFIKISFIIYIHQVLLGRLN